MVFLAAFLLGSNIFMMVHSSNLEQRNFELEKQVKAESTELEKMQAAQHE